MKRFTLRSLTTSTSAGTSTAPVNNFPPPVSKLFCQHHQQVRFVEEGVEEGETSRCKIAEDSWVAPNAMLSGNVEIWHKANVWYGVIIRGDQNLVRIGYSTNIQERTVITESFGPLSSIHDGSTIVGHYVSVGRGCILRACTIEPHCIIGDGSVLEEGSYMKSSSQLQPGSVLKKDQVVPLGELWGGNPAVFVRKLTDEEKAGHEAAAEAMHVLSLEHKEEFFMPSDTYREAEELEYPVGYHKID